MVTGSSGFIKTNPTWFSSEIDDCLERLYKRLGVVSMSRKS
jgi:hypothetical protein